MRRISPLHSLIALSIFVILWLAWSSYRLHYEFDHVVQQSKHRSNSAQPDRPDNSDENDLPFATHRPLLPLETLQRPFTIVTGASSNHFCALEAFLYSLSEVFHRLERTEIRPTIIVYDLGGMKPAQKTRMRWLKENQYMDEYKTFNYSAYPDFWDINVARGEYGWKAGIIKEVADKYRGLVLWFDSGNLMSLDFLRYLPGYLEKNGFWSPMSAGSIQEYTHPGLPQFYGESIEAYEDETNCSGGAVAFDTSNDEIYNGILNEWFKCSMNKECIAPTGSSRTNHRQDQAALTFLAKKLRFMEQCRHFPEYYGVTVHQDKVCKERIRSYNILKGVERNGLWQ